MILALALSAVAATPLDIDALVAAAPEAERLLADCEARGRACGATRRDLAHAFVLHVAHTAATSGRVDATGAASALLLDPDATRGWEPLMPARPGTPDPWVVAWIDNRTLTPRPVPAPPERTPVLDGFVSGGSSEVRLLGSFSERERRRGTVGLRAHGTLGPVTALVDARVMEGVAGLAYNPAWAVRPPDSASSVDTQVLGGLGLRWARPDGAELFGLVGGAVGWSRLVGPDVDTLEARGFPVVPRTWGAGLLASVGGVHPLVPHGRLAMAWDAWALSTVHWRSTPASAGDPDLTPMAPSSPLRTPVVEVVLRAAPWHVGPTFAAGVHLDGVADDMYDLGEPSPGPMASVGWIARRTR